MSKKSGVLRNILHNIRALGSESRSNGSPENPNNSLTIEGGFSGDTSISDQSITGYSAIWKGVNLYARDVAKLPLEVFKRVKSGKERDTDHPAFRLLRSTPNDYQTAFYFRMSMQERAVLRGNGYAFIERNNAANPTELIQLPPSTFLVREHTSEKDSGKVWAIVGDLMDVRIPYRDILHIHGMGTDLSGFSLVDIARESIKLGQAAKSYGTTFFTNGAAPYITLETDRKLDPEAQKRIAQSWADMHRGATKAWKTAVLEQGLKVKPFSVSNKDSQFLELRKFERTEIANFLLLQPHKVGDDSRTSFSSLEQENQSYLNESLDPWLVIWEQECWEKLLTESQKEEYTHVIEFNRNALLRADTEARFNAYTKAINFGIMTVNEVRARENLNQAPGDGGNNHYIPVNLAKVEEDGSITGVGGVTSEAPADDTDDDDNARGGLVAAHRAAIRAPVSRMVTRIRKASTRGKIDIEKERGIIHDACHPAVNAAARSLDIEMNIDVIPDILLDKERITQDNVIDEIVSTLLGSEENGT